MFLQREDQQLWGICAVVSVRVYTEIAARYTEASSWSIIQFTACTGIPLIFVADKIHEIFNFGDRYPTSANKKEESNGDSLVGVILFPPPPPMWVDCRKFGTEFMPDRLSDMFCRCATVPRF